MIRNFSSRYKKFSGKHPRLTKAFRIFLWGCFTFCLILIGFYISIYLSLPSRAELRNIQHHTASEVYSEDGVLLGKYYIQDRTHVSLEEISPFVTDALLATEDIRFFQHEGVDTRGLMRVLIKSILLQDESAGGGSTLSQQLAKNLYPRKRYWALSLPINKMREIILATKLEDIFTKEQILNLYLNTVPFGDNAYGIASASRRFFNTSPDSLRVEEAAVLIGMLKGTTLYNPKRNPERSRERRNTVLGQMQKYGFIGKGVYDSLSALPLVLRYNSASHSDGIATYFRTQLRLELQDWLNKHPKEDGSVYNLYTDGLKIYTTLDSRMQQHAEEAVRQHMKALQKQFEAHWGKRNPWGKNKDVIDKALRRTERYASLRQQNKSEQEIRESFEEKVPMNVFSYEGEQTVSMSPIDSLNYYLKFLHPGFLAIETGSGKVKAWVGGIDFKYFKYDHVNINSKRQAGSTFKPIVYAAALNQNISPCEYLPNERKVFEEYDNWSPRNSDDTYGGEYSMQGALTNSVNTVSAQLILKAGIQNVVQLARNMGVQSPLKPVPSLALGTADVSLYEMVTAYSVFANRGNYIEPLKVTKITDNRSNVIHDFSKDQKKYRVLSSTNADLIRKMLQNVVDKGTAGRLRYKYGVDGEAAGKTGTTQSQADGWFIGFTPKVVAGAWVGAEDRRIHFRSLDLGQGASTALPIWGIFMNKVFKDPSFKGYRSSRFPKPSEEILASLSCEDYIAPDTTDLWWWPFDNKKNTPEDRTLEKVEKKEERKASGDNKAIDKIKDLFRKKKKK